MNTNHKALVDALRDVGDIVTDPEWCEQCREIRGVIDRRFPHLESPPLVEIALFWQWRSDHWSARWLMSEPESTILEWWAKWCDTGRLGRRFYDA